MKHDQGASTYAAMISAMAEYVDCFLAETISSVEEAMQAMEGLSQSAENIRKYPMLISYTLQADGCLRSGEVAKLAIPRTIDFAKSKDINLVAILFNCAEPEAINMAFESLADLKDLPILLGAYANRLTPVPDGWTMEGSDAPQPFRNDLGPEQYYDKFVSVWRTKFGVQMVGGCCGITPEHIKYMHDRLKY